ncbi:TetR/AcrR family transcriptional regulator [Hamadaea tsunoensis]|uniref:TetR/AcrR family transcriptional regulator n=1 Tax=Hamadaea tsunoensis TaxID=53368 RepID=UPI00041B7ACF|nr:TetR/AcrR family transcriptional regulator [Hamadaea tsunoensis]
MPPRKRAHPAERRAEILAAALDLFAERGYRGTSLAAVADRIGLTQQGVLHYFPSKDALLTEVLRRRDEIDEQTFAGAAREDALATMERLVAYNATRPGLVQSFTVLSADSVTEDHPAKEFFVERYRRMREMATVPAAGLTAEQTAALLIAVMDGLQLQWLLDPSVDMVEIFHGFAALLRNNQNP